MSSRNIHSSYSHGGSDYERYSDYSVDEGSDAYYNNGGDVNYEAPEGRAMARSRNSILSLGGGLLGRAKHMLRGAPEYTEMDLPLTEAGARRTAAADGSPQAGRSKKFDFKFGFLSEKPDPSTLGPREIYLNNPPANATNRYVNNHISTTKYNLATFFPKFFYEQFSKSNNLFFLFTAILQQIPNVTPTNRWTTIVPLIVVLFVSAFKELVEDNKRRKQDRESNGAKTQVLRGSSFEDTTWVNIVVGDIVRVQSEEPIPADLALLASSEPEGLCYIETANLDGETNLKLKQAIPETSELVDPHALSRLSGRIRSEQPNSSLYTYEATLAMQTGGTERTLPLAPDQLLLRGATLRNTPWVHGVVVFTGHETKLMKNSTTTPIKRTAVERLMNWQIVMLVAILIGIITVVSIGDLVIRKQYSDELGYMIFGTTNFLKQFFTSMGTNWILFSNLVPISLFVTIEVVKFQQGELISGDLDMYYEPTDTAANCRTSSLVEELGQIAYIFSDKTGTLTRNIMEFKQCSIAGIPYSEEVPEDRRPTEENGVLVDGVYDFKRLRQNVKDHPSRLIMHHFLALLATCHTVIPEIRDEKPGVIKYQAASPDEGALVEGAVVLGYKFIARKPRSVMIEVAGQQYEYELLAVCEFNSTRKRMSTIFRCPDGVVRCYTKGADTVIMERLGPDNPIMEATLKHLEDYASEGLRTLCLAMREIPEEEFQSWWKKFDEAATTVGGNRADELDKAAELIEHDFTLLGATAIEDKLQEGVPDTIHTLQTAGIKVWVLTGDRQETAINIGMSCRLLSEESTLLLINEEDANATRDNMLKKIHEIQTVDDPETLALVIDGKSLTFALEKSMEQIFFDLAVKCKSVICCRVSPLQKALVVKLVKRHTKSLLLAIGDGANDVSMIQAAHVGVGISGMEGLQAARSADVAIGQFRFLRKLLLNIVLIMTQFWYALQNGYSGEPIFESWILSFFNVFFTVAPPFVMGIFDQFVSARLLDRYPQLYTSGIKGVFFRMHSFWLWIFNGLIQSALLYYASIAIFWFDVPLTKGQPGGHWVWGTALYFAILTTVLGKAALITNIWTKYAVLAIPGSWLFFLGFLPAYAILGPKLIGWSPELIGITTPLYTSPQFWLMGIVLPAFCLLRDLVWKYAKRMYLPQPYHHVQEIQKYNVQDYRPRMEQFQKAVRKVRQVQRMRKQRGYAFSQADESQSRVLAAYDTTKHRGRYGEMTSSRPQ
ncbi:MAG: hypothetical protein M1834_009032 [Cirrosporium novae-zelandiae]|nr:MAG: hypothetical protein M1834_009032 [Cirrosporium novae-zelandiae]